MSEAERDITDAGHRSLLLVLDGAGVSNPGTGNAITPETMPFLFSCMAEHGYATLEASGDPVGLQAGHTGNSEVGHLTIGAGQRVPSVLETMSSAWEDGSWEAHSAWQQLADTDVLHLVGLVSDAGVHGYWPNIIRCARLARTAGVNEVVIHAVLDGVDAQAGSAPRLLEELLAAVEPLDGVHCTDVMGRRWACDRSGQLEITQVLVDHMSGRHDLAEFTSAGLEAFLDQSACEKDFPCHRFGEHRPVREGEPVLLTNNRADRTAQVAQVFSKTNPVFALVELGESVREDRVFFPKHPLPEGVESELQRAGIRSLRIAEQCKFPHVTYFFNGFHADLGEDRVCIDSVAESDIADHPEMSAEEITDAILAALDEPGRRAIIANLANLDQVGHIGRYELAVEAAQNVDRQIRRLYEKCMALGWSIIITSDHGNADRMVDDADRPFGSHSDRPVPLVCIPAPDRPLRLISRNGSLAHVGATYLTALGLKPPSWMTPSLIDAPVAER